MENNIPPQAIELENAVLGAIILEAHSLNDIRDIIKVETFYKDANQKIYNAILTLDKQNKTPDLLTIPEQLKKTNDLEGDLNYFYISKLTNNLGSSANIIEHASIIQELYLKREIIRICNEKIKSAFSNDSDVFDLLGDLSKENESLLTSNSSGVFHISDCIKDVFGVINKNISGEIKGMLTGFQDYDKFALGEQPGDVRYIAGETSQGKTAYAICEAFNQALMGYKVAFFSYEMTRNQLTARLMALASNIGSKSILMDKLTEQQVNDINTKINELLDTNLYIIEVENKEYYWLEQKIKTLKAKYDIQKVFIDYIQLIGMKNIKKRNEQVAMIANNIKFLAKHKNINIPICVLSQLKRDSGHPEPELWRLKESGDIENSADVVCGIWRPAFYGKESLKIELNTGYEDINTKGIGILQVLKGRNIGMSNFRLSWNPKIPQYSDFEEVF
jgi:replicative DNA helicase